MSGIVQHDAIEGLIFLIRNRKVMIDRDLAELYGVPTKALNQAVKRNIERFPEEFMFQLTSAEKNELVTKCDRFTSWKYSLSLPFAFTEYGVAMLSGVLNSKKAVEINVKIIRAFIRLRNVFSENNDLRKAIEHIERRLDVHDRQIQIAFAALKSILQPEALPQIAPHRHYSPEGDRRMGFGKKTK